MTVVASYGIVLCGNSDDLQHRYRGRIEKVKFGVPINEAFAHDIPATLLVLLLKVNKEGPLKKDIWRAPGNQAHVRKLSHIMQHGRLVNIANFSVYTAASVIKKFLSKLPGGIFGVENEQLLFNTMLNNPDEDKQRQVFCRMLCTLAVPSQHLLVLLFGTFRMIADNADSMGTKMTPEAIGISVAPSLFHSCIHDGKVKVEDVQRFKLASQVVSQIIRSFGHTNLFPRECYEFYARITGRTLRVDENWLFTFQYPSRSRSHPEVSVVCEVGGVDEGLRSCRQRAARLGERLSNSLGQVALAMPSLPCQTLQGDSRSLSHLAGVHERQTQRMHCRSQWFLSPLLSARPSSAAASTQLRFTVSVHRSESPECGVSMEEKQRLHQRPPPATPRLEHIKQSSSSSSSSSASTRRRSWRVHALRQRPRLENMKTGSLDMAEESTEGKMIRRASVGEEWRVEGDEEIEETEGGQAPRKKRSIKKHS